MQQGNRGLRITHLLYVLERWLQSRRRVDRALLSLKGRQDVFAQQANDFHTRQPDSTRSWHSFLPAFAGCSALVPYTHLKLPTILHVDFMMVAVC